MECRILRQYGLEIALVFFLFGFTALFAVGVWESTGTVPKAMYIGDYTGGACKQDGPDIQIDGKYVCFNITLLPTVVAYACYYRPSQVCNTVTHNKPSLDSVLVDRLLGGFAMLLFGALGVAITVTLLITRLRKPLDSLRSYSSNSTVNDSCNL